jgi:hypothetical protein
MDVEITGGPAMSVTDGLGHQGGADHLDAVPAPDQTVLSEQDVGQGAPATAGPPETTALLSVTVTHHPHSGPAPGPQPTAASWASQLAGHQGALDFWRVGSYDLHVCLRAPGRALPSLGQRWSGGVLARMGLGTLSPGAKKGNPKVALKPVTFLDVATWPVGVQPGRRSTDEY